jgi:hypothetical protein
MGAVLTVEVTVMKITMNNIDETAWIELNNTQYWGISTNIVSLW